jgi:hypothetical protein
MLQQLQFHRPSSPADILLQQEIKGQVIVTSLSLFIVSAVWLVEGKNSSLSMLSVSGALSIYSY